MMFLFLNWLSSEEMFTTLIVKVWIGTFLIHNIFGYVSILYVLQVFRGKQVKKVNKFNLLPHSSLYIDYRYTGSYSNGKNKLLWYNNFTIRWVVKKTSTNFHTLLSTLQLQSTLLIKYCFPGKDHSPSFRYPRPLFLCRSVPLRGSKLCSSNPYGTIHSSERFTG